MDFELEEGDRCPEPGCVGKMEWRCTGDCSCYISPPCNNCTNGVLTCDVCGWSTDDMEAG